MSSFNPYAGLTDPQSVAIRPLSGGMRLDVPTMQVPLGAGLVVGNLIVEPNGLRRRPVLIDHRSDAMISEPGGEQGVVQDIALMWTTAGAQKVLVLTEKYPYLLQLSGYTRLVSSYATGFLGNTGATVTGSGTQFNASVANLAVGDAVWYSSLFLGYAKSIDSTTQITLDRAPANHATKKTTRVDRCFFDATPAYFTDYAVISNKVVFADSGHRMMAYDGTTYAEFDSAVPYKPAVVAFFGDRAYMANTIEGAVDARQRTRWSTVTDTTDFDALQYLDLPYTPGFIRKLAPLGSLLVMYMSDSIWIGRGTSISGDELPTAFERYNTGGVGLAGTRAMCSYLDGHFLLMQDGAYYISSTLESQRIGKEVVKEMLRDRGGLERAIVRPDPENDSVLFAVPPTAQKTYNRIWRYNYRSNAWSYDESDGTAIARIAYESLLTWSDLNDTTGGTAWTDMDYFKSWSTMKANGKTATWVGSGGKVYFFDRTGQTALPVVFESGDVDFEGPDTVKTLLRLSLKVSGERSTDLSFSVSVSADRGRSWKSGGVLTIPSDSDEDAVNFRCSGSTLRFRLSSNSLVEEYTIEEVVLKVSGRGGEVHLAANR